MASLPGPYEIFELEDGQTHSTKVDSWELGEVEIHPKYKPEGKFITALRIHVPKHFKDYFPFYWDITSSTLVAQLLPFLESEGYAQKTYSITKHGVAPRARFTLKVV
jgi:hypothetical protein